MLDSASTAMPHSSSRLHAWVLASFVGIAALQCWPLPLHMPARLTGDPASDAGVYVWNLWIFQHELIERGSNPFTTDLIFAADQMATDLSLHNYTVASDILALPLVRVLGVVTTFNLIYIFNVALAGFAVYLLVRHVYRQTPVGTAAAWLAGLLFACSPFLVARGTAHFSLVAAAALPFFVLFFDRAWRDHRPRDAVAAGACLAWAGYSDPYYAVYCVLLAACVAAATELTVWVEARRDGPPRRRAILIDSLLFAAILIVAAVGIFDLEVLHLGPLRISMRSLYTPVLVLTGLVCLRALMVWRPRVSWRPTSTPSRMLRQAAVVALSGAVLLSPLIHAMGVRMLEGRMVTAPVLWRSSAPGLDLLAFLVPNPNHPLAPRALGDWLAAQPGRENVAAIPWVALGVIVVAWRWSATPARRTWLWIAGTSAVLSLGPFLRVAGVLTYIPTPWTFLRYVPVLGEARMPARFAVLVILGVAILFAGSLSVLARRSPGRGRFVYGVVAAALVFELLPVPRTLYSAAIPAVYRTVASDPRPVAVLELPFGIKDGLTFLGDFSARSQFHQTAHGKRLVGGYLSRVSDQRKAAYLASPTLRALIELSEGKPLAPATGVEAVRAAADLIERIRLEYVVMHTARTPAALREFAVEAFALEPAGAGDGYELFRASASVARQRATDHAADDAEGIED